MMGKYMVRLLSTPGILHFKEKHGDHYYVCLTPEDYCKAAMQVLRQRVEDGYWYGDDELEPEEIMKQEAASYAGVVYTAPHLIQDGTIAKQICDSNDIERAFEFIWGRSDYEYEGVTIERIEEVST